MFMNIMKIGKHTVAVAAMIHHKSDVSTAIFPTLECSWNQLKRGPMHMDVHDNITKDFDGPSSDED